MTVRNLLTWLEIAAFLIAASLFVYSLGWSLGLAISLAVWWVKPGAWA